MKRVALFSTMFAVLAVLVIGVQAAVAAGPLTLNWQKDLNPSKCVPGQPVVDITHGVVNDADPGAFGYWAWDNYTRRVRVWQVGQDSFCAIVEYKGTFTSIAGASPNGTDPDGIAAGIEGKWEGGYLATFNASLKANPTYPTEGFIGTFDYGWNGDAYTDPTSPFDWLEPYFDYDTVSNVAQPYIGFKYKSKDNGSMTILITDTQFEILGDITD